MRSQGLLLVTVVLLGCAAAANDANTNAEPDSGSATTRTCTHVVDVVSRSEAGQDLAMLARIRSDCEASLVELENRQPGIGECMLATPSTAAIEACEPLLPRSESVLRSLGPSYAELCEHVMNIMKREMDSSGIPPTEQEIAEFLAACATEMEVEWQKMDGDEFRREAVCVMQANAMAEMKKCEPESGEPQDP